MKQFAQQRRKGNKQFGVDYRWLRSSFFYVRLKERLLASQLISCHSLAFTNSANWPTNMIS